MKVTLMLTDHRPSVPEAPVFVARKRTLPVLLTVRVRVRSAFGEVWMVSSSLPPPPVTRRDFGVMLGVLGAGMRVAVTVIVGVGVAVPVGVGV